MYNPSSTNTICSIGLPDGRSLFAPKGSNLLSVLQKAGISVSAPCGGKGTCRKCWVGITLLTDTPSSPREGAIQQLACSYEITSDLQLSAACPDEGEDTYKLISSLKKIQDNLFAVVDLGSTIIKAGLFDADSQPLVLMQTPNPQRAYGHDVLSRITASFDRCSLYSMRYATRATITRLIEGGLNRSASNFANLKYVILTGNTAMLHILLPMDPRRLGASPFTAQSLEAIKQDASILGFPQAELFIPPGISAFVGADLTAGLFSIATQHGGLFPDALYQKKFFLIDMGTNTEIIAGNGKFFAATSCASGPALEGMNIECGTTAQPGVITDIRFHNSGPLFKIGGKEYPLKDVPTSAPGFCGSAIVALTAELLRTGAISSSGDFTVPLYPRWLSAHFEEHGGQMRFTLSHRLFFTQKDVRQLQLAKAAIFSACQILLKKLDLNAEAVQHVYIAGDFGGHLKLEDLKRIGFLPRFSNAEFSFPGNTSFDGLLKLRSALSLFPHLKNFTQSVNSVSLSEVAGYEELFIHSLGFP